MSWRRHQSEIEAHIEEKALDLIDSGMEPDKAWQQARREFGNATRVIESSREVWVWTWLEHLGQDLRYAFRAMAANRSFTYLAVASLALGIGANTAIYSLMDAILLRSLPVKDPESLVVLKFRRPGVSIGETSGHGSRGKMSMHSTSGGSFDGNFSIFPYPAFQQLEQRNDLFTSVFSYYGQKGANVTVNGGSVIADCMYVSGGYFDGLETLPSAGRNLTAADDEAGAIPAAMVSYGFAQQHFGSAGSTLGKTIAVNGLRLTIVGVSAPGFFGVNPESSPEVYAPLHSYLLSQPSRFTENGQIFSHTSTYWLDVMARVKPGVTRQQVTGALEPWFAEYFDQYSGPTQERARLFAMPGASGLDSLRHRYSQPLYVLLAMVVLILAIACANLANLLLARASARHREMAVRLSLGASRWRVVRQLLTESLLLSAMGAGCGLVIAEWSVRMLTALLARGREDFTLRAGLNGPVLAVTLAVAIGSGIVFGLAPALQSTKVDVFPALRETRTSQAARKFRWIPLTLGQVLVVVQITLSFLLLVGAGLFVRTLTKLQSLELGFNQENLLILSLNTTQSGYKDDAALAFHESLRQRFAKIPGVKDATIAAEAQLDGGTWSLDFKLPESPGESIGAPLLPIGPNYLTTMQVPILLGRDINVADEYRKPIPAVISESFARKHFGADNPLGRRVLMRFDSGDNELEIVGVAKNARYGSLKEDPPEMLYVDYRHNKGFLVGMMRVVLRTTGDPILLANTAREVLRQADPGVPLAVVSTQKAVIENTINQEIIFARLCTAFAGLALLIACVGLYGTTAYNVARRTTEIGIRMALGAKPGSVLSMVLRDVAVLGLAGLAIGVPVAMGMSKLVASLLFGLQPNDLLTMAAAVAILLAAMLVAAFLPAQRASHLDPMTALRHE